jgi:phosphatidate cytidylyltransferase
MVGESRLPMLGIVLAYVLALVCFQIKDFETLSVEQTGFAFFVSMIFSIGFSCLAYLRVESYGLFYVILGITIPWLSDMGAYFAGTFFGRHKLCPNISPKKTVEGLAGGIIVSVLGSMGISYLYQIVVLKDTATISLWQVALVVLLCAPISVLGDLFASIIKRQCHVKDFGNIMPGHGGIMDRFDSLMPTVPILYLFVQLVPLVY